MFNHKNNTILMKKTLYYFSLFIAVSLLATSCTPIEDSLDKDLLIGEWQSGTLFYSYLASGNGTTWDTGDDVSEEEAQAFTWTLVATELTHIHVLEVGGSVPKVYTVTELTATTLKYNDDFGKIFSFSKVL